HAAADPRTPVEALLAGVLGDVLGVERVDVEASFFDLGGHSLLAVRALSRVRDVLGVEVPLRAFFEAPAVAALAPRVEALRRAGAPALPPVRAVARGGPLPLSFAQERLWFLDRMEPGRASYTLSSALRVTGPLDAAALERALGRVVLRHEALRTTFVEVDGAPAQVVAPFAGFPLPVEDLSGLEDGARAAAARRRGAEEAERPFDLAAGPLFRARLLRLAAEEHVLLTCIHHIVCDRWSMDVLRRELAALYADPDGLPPLPVQYGDYAAWQRDHLRGAALDGPLAWWRDRLAGAPEVLDLPADRPPPATPGARGGRVSAVLPAGVAAGLDAVGRAEGATPFMVLLAVFQALLARYAGTDDVVVGTPVAGRARRELEPLIGLFVNTLVLRTDLGGAPAFREVVRRVRGTALGAYDHQDVPFDRLVAELRPERAAGRTPLFQVMFTVVEAGDGAGPAPAGLAIEGAGGEARASKFDLSLTCVRGGAGVETVLEYDADRFDAATAARMLEHLGRLARHVARDPGRRPAEVELLGRAERRQVLRGWNGTARPYPLDRCIHRLVEAQAARTPHAPALVHEDVALTYARLNGIANGLARALRGRGVGRGGFVPVLAERGVHVAVAMLAVLKAGAAFVPLDAAWPEARLRGVLRALHPPLLLATEDVAERAAGLGVPVVPVRLDGDGAPDLPDDGVGPDDPVYAIFTSGSTGAPKGAVVPHGGITNRFLWMTETFGAASARCVLQTTRHVYDSAVWQLLWPLTLGGHAVVPRADGEADADHLAGLIHARGVTMTDFVPSVFNALVPELVADARARERLSSLRTVIVGGEQVTAETTHRFMDCFPGVRVVNLYGPTECSIGSIHHRVARGDGGRIPIGRPIANTTALVLDRGGRLAPPGVAGEIHLGGRCVGLGYLGDPARTAAAFVPDPYGPPGARLYRTGDLGRCRADGAMECLGRLDEQVKVRGLRMEPGEIEGLLRRVPGITDARVLAHDAAPGDRRLVAYVAAAPPASVQPAALRAHLAAHLPQAMVPAAFVVLPALPRTPGGKVDRQALPAPAWDEGAAYVAPRTPVEEIVAGLWARALGVERVGVHEPFFALGGHSLLATRLVARARRELGVEVPLRAFFEHPTVAGMSGLVQRALAGSPARPLAPRRVARAGDPPASWGQERLWRAHRARPGDPSFNLHYGLVVRGALDARGLARALTEVVRRHEALRTTLRESGGRVLQVVHPAAPVPLPRVDLRGLAPAARDRVVHALAAGERAGPFDLERGPLLRARLVRTGPAEHVLLLTLHHAATDGWSTGVLAR
ncbi:amino acid adenylation domain-containing protein, partial [Longimicrobium sp.]|uniref:amino acid adenylation domain-containing protein n=1 Tax=Longimicrobium sp. TaxID=2029185 RepID=UPI002E30B75E